MKKSEFETHQKIIFINITENVKEIKKQIRKQFFFKLYAMGKICLLDQSNPVL